jgi:hypothetical protein
MNKTHSTATTIAYTDLLVYASIVAVIGGCWWLVETTQLRSSSPEGYWLGVVGGTLALLLFAYPVRKRMRSSRALGPTKWWFVVHMVLGVLAPATILVHSTFKIGSLNAGVALYSMLIVAGSGVVGRFLYTRTFRGFQAEKLETLQLQTRLLEHPAAHALNAQLQPWVGHLEQATVHAHAGALLHIEAFFKTPRRHGKAWLQLKALTKPLPMAEKKHLLQLGKAYLSAQLRVQQFSSVTRLFALWHLLHVPFVYIMVVCALAHVVAVHVY